MMKKLMLLGVLLGAATGADATTVLDQSTYRTDDSHAWGGSYGQKVPSWVKGAVLQTFTIGMTGTLTQLDLLLYTFNNMAGGAQVTIYRGDNFAGVAPTSMAGALYTGTTPMSSLDIGQTSRTTSFNLTAAGIQVTAGEKLSLMITGDQPYDPWGETMNAGGVEGTNVVYGGGRAYEAPNWGLGFIAAPSYHMQSVQFRTFVDADVVAVPEPATWAMIITGFGLVGGTLRRRGKVAARVTIA